MDVTVQENRFFKTLQKAFKISSRLKIFSNIGVFSFKKPIFEKFSNDHINYGLIFDEYIGLLNGQSFKNTIHSASNASLTVVGAVTV